MLTSRCHRAPRSIEGDRIDGLVVAFKALAMLIDLFSAEH